VEHADVAARGQGGPGFNSTALAEAREAADKLMAAAARELWRSSADAEACAQRLGLQNPEGGGTPEGRAALMSAVAARRAYELAAERAHGAWAGAEDAQDALRRAENEALLYQVQAARHLAAQEADARESAERRKAERITGEDALREDAARRADEGEEDGEDGAGRGSSRLEIGPALRYDGRNGWKICESDLVCGADRPSEPEIDNSSTPLEEGDEGDGLRPHPMRSPVWSGCLHGCAGALEGVEDRRLNQVIEHGPRAKTWHKNSSCEAYCTGVVDQPAVVEGMAWAERDPQTVTGEQDAWVGACLRGCRDGYAQRPGCSVSGEGATIRCD
jgi:hypothetical protein